MYTISIQSNWKKNWIFSLQNNMLHTDGNLVDSDLAECATSVGISLEKAWECAWM